MNRRMIADAVRRGVFETFEQDPYVALAEELKATLKQLDEKYGSVVTPLRERFERLDAHQREVDEGLRSARAEAAEVLGQFAEAKQRLDGLEAAKAALEAQLEEFTRSGQIVSGAPDASALAEQMAEVEWIREMRAYVKNPAAERAGIHRFGDESAPTPGDVAEVRLYHAAYGRYLRGGVANLHQLRGGMPEETFAVGSSLYHPSFGFAVPVTYTGRMMAELFTYGSFRSDALVRMAVGNVVHLMFTAGKVTVTVGNDRLPYNPGDLPEGYDVQYGVDKWQATVSMTSDTIEDVQNLPGFLAMQAGARWAEVEGDKHVNGNGANQPLGVLSTAKADTAITSLDKDEEPIGTIKAVKSGVAAAIHNTSSTAAGYAASPLAHAIWNLHGRYRPRAKIYMNRITYATYLTLVDGDGQYLMPPSMREPGGMMLFGYPVSINDHFPDIAANAYPAMVADLRNGYEIADRRGMMTLVDPFSDKPNTEYTFTWRSGGRPADTRAIRLIKCAA